MVILRSDWDSSQSWPTTAYLQHLVSRWHALGQVQNLSTQNIVYLLAKHSAWALAEAAIDTRSTATQSVTTEGRLPTGLSASPVGMLDEIHI